MIGFDPRRARKPRWRGGISELPLAERAPTVLTEP